MSEHQILLESVSFGWNEHKLLFMDIDCTIPCDKVIIMTGENGCGKSTFTSLIAGTIKPSMGIITWRDIASYETQANKIYDRLLYLQQKTELNLIGVDAISDLNIWSLSQTHDEDTAEKIEESLKYWGLSDIRHRPVWELSAGELKRLCLTGLNLSPQKYWIMDEPEAGLDTAYCVKLISAIRKKTMHNNGAFIITHRLHLYKDFYDEHWHINSDGTITISQNGAV